MKGITGYDAERRNTSMRDAKGLETGFRFDAAGNLVEKAYPNGERTAYAYDPNRRLREMKEYGAASGGAGGLSPAVTRYDWDAQGNRTGEAVERDGAITAKVFGYDVLNRLTQVEEPQGVQQYAYDGLGNLVRESGPEYARRYEYNALNQLVRREESRAGSSPTALAYEYDLRGNRVREKSAQDGRVMKEFSYDGANRMVRGETEKGSSFYRYDGLGRRVGREQEKNSVQYVVDFVSGRNDDLAAYTQGFFAQSYSYANGQRIQQVTKAWEGAQDVELPEELYIHEDIMGSTKRWSTGNGDTYAQMEYDVWGLPIQSGNEEENILNPRYTNHTYDATLDVYHAQFRFLDATNRSFTAVDPIKDGLNWYGYCEANPATFIDPLGLFLPGTEIEPGATGEDVVALQIALLEAIHAINPDSPSLQRPITLGVYDVYTEALVIVYKGHNTSYATGERWLQNQSSNVPTNVVNLSMWKSLGLPYNRTLEQEFGSSYQGGGTSMAIRGNDVYVRYNARLMGCGALGSTSDVLEAIKKGIESWSRTGVNIQGINANFHFFANTSTTLNPFLANIFISSGIDLSSTGLGNGGMVPDSILFGGWSIDKKKNIYIKDDNTLSLGQIESLIAHEFGHVMGLFDAYTYTYESPFIPKYPGVDPYGPIDDMDIMYGAGGRKTSLDYEMILYAFKENELQWFYDYDKYTTSQAFYH